MRRIRLAEVKGFTSLFVLGGMLLVAVALPMATKLVQQSQENRSSAATVECATSTVGKTKCSDGAVRKCKKKTITGKVYYLWTKTKGCDHGCNSAGTACYTSSSPSSATKVSCTYNGKKIASGGKKCIKGVLVSCSTSGKTTKKTCKNGCSGSGGSCATESVCTYESGEYSNGSITCQSDGKLYKCSVSNKKGSWSVFDTCGGKGCNGSKCKNSDIGGIPQDDDCTKFEGVCQKSTEPCNVFDGHSYVDNLCGDSGNDVKCCAKKYLEAWAVSVKQDRTCTSIGGVCESIKGGCGGGEFKSGYCPSSDSSKFSCCIQTSCNSSECNCARSFSCEGVGCLWNPETSICQKMPVVSPYKYDNYHTSCVSDSDCIDGKCAMTDDTRTRVCIPRSGTVYVCDRYGNDYYSEKWVNGSQVGSGQKCGNGCKTVTGICNELKADRSICGNDAECKGGKCVGDDTRTKVCISSTGTYYVCDRYNNEYFSEKWVNGSQVGKGTLCPNGCNMSTGECN